MNETHTRVSSQFLGSYTDRGVSTEAHLIQQYVADAMSAMITGSTDADQRWRRLSQELHRVYSECSTPDWDGHGAHAVAPDAYQNAIHFLNLLPAFAPLPEVGAEPDGEFSFEWYHSPHYNFSVSVGGGNTISFAGLFGKGRNHGSEYLGDELPGAVKSNLGRVLSKPGGDRG